MKEFGTDPSKQIKLGFLSGLVPREKSLPFERILFRATRGNVFLKQSEVEEPVTDPSSGQKVNVNLFSSSFVSYRSKVSPFEKKLSVPNDMTCLKYKLTKFLFLFCILICRAILKVRIKFF